MKSQNTESRVKKLEQALRIIQTWASCDHLSGESRSKAMKDIEKKCQQALSKVAQ